MLLIPFLALALTASQPVKPLPMGNLPLDQKRIHQDYNDGSFEAVIRDIEAFQKKHETYNYSDSIFIAKHLAVVYSANPDTREKGKYYMYRLLEMLPSAKLLDMYVSDEIDRIFDKIKEEFAQRQRSFGLDSTQTSMPSQAPATQKSVVVTTTETPKSEPKVAAQKSNSKTYWLAAGVGAAAVTVVVAYIALSPSSNNQDKVYEVP
jgi:hypothetical protein